MDRRRGDGAIMLAMHGSLAWRAGLIQAASVAVVAIALGALLPHSFFEEYGWAAGPGAWAACAALTAAVLRLPVVPVLLGAAVAGLPSLATVLIGAHWLGVPVAVGVFGLWCGRLGA